MVDLGKYKVILASKSPRRHALLQGLEIPFAVRTKEVNEDFDPALKAHEIPTFLAKKKASAFRENLADDELLVTSDTVVWLGDRVFNKPDSEVEAVEMIAKLSGRMHEVITAVCLTTTTRQHTFFDLTKVYFAEVDRTDIEHYVARYKPFDKAGAYGIQEWIGYAGIDKIEGSFYNVMGFPTQMFYTELKAFLKV